MNIIYRYLRQNGDKDLFLRSLLEEHRNVLRDKYIYVNKWTGISSCVLRAVKLSEEGKKKISSKCSYSFHKSCDHECIDCWLNVLTDLKAYNEPDVPDFLKKKKKEIPKFLKR